jgi:hypothetical protein
MNSSKAQVGSDHTLPRDSLRIDLAIVVALLWIDLAVVIALPVI